MQSCFSEFLVNKNPYLTVVIGDFNAKSHNWQKDDKTTASGSKLEITTSHYGRTQIVNEPTHILEDSSSNINLVFASQPNMALDIVAHSLLHPNYHHQIVFANFDFKIFILDPTKGESGMIDMQILLRSKIQLQLSTGKKHFVIALSIRRAIR